MKIKLSCRQGKLISSGGGEQGPVKGDRERRKGQTGFREPWQTGRDRGKKGNFKEANKSLDFFSSTCLAPGACHLPLPAPPPPPPPSLPAPHQLAHLPLHLAALHLRRLQPVHRQALVVIAINEEEGEQLDCAKQALYHCSSCENPH